MITEWEGDKSKSNPYEVEVEFETEADVKRKLLALECKDDPAGGSAREGMSESAWLSTGLVMEETQRRLQLEVTNNKSPTSVQAAQLSQKRLLLKRQIKIFRQEQRSHVRSIDSLITSTSTTSTSEPESVKLWLPSHLPKSERLARCSPSLVDKEVQLRTAQCNGALEQIWLTQRAKRHVAIYKRRHVTGQRASTRTNIEFERLELKITNATRKYRAARDSLVELLDAQNLPPHLLPLRDSDVCPPPCFRHRPHTSPSQDPLRGGYTSRADQWRLRAEYPTSGHLPSPSLSDARLVQGISAFAHRQRLVNENLRASFLVLWAKPPGKRSRFAESEPQPPNLQDAVTADDETLMTELLALVESDEDSVGEDDDDDDE
ncbi:hypothetical protein ONZ45_g19692 [Pleurotus djamor]|nr:hypothetical protein ONZ45_g19692 [Pleurotus djamor]